MTLSTVSLARWLALPVWLGISAMAAAQGTEPAQKPLLSAQSGAKPNLMIALDNSGSMAFPYHESYGVLADVDTPVELGNCAAYGAAYGQYAPPQPDVQANINSRVCLIPNQGQWVAGTRFPAGPRIVRNSRLAQRSAQVNPLYYDPRVTYEPRIDANGRPLVPNDGITFISNSLSVPMRYRVTGANTFFLSTLAGNEPGGTPLYGLYWSFRVPKHVTHTATTAPAFNQTFTYATCTAVSTNPANGLQDGCDVLGPITVIRLGAPDPVQLPATHSRTDCGAGATTCTNAQEIANIINWYRYYSYRQIAVGSAIGQALNTGAYQGKLRVGYMPINNNGASIATTPGTVNDPALLRGVRELSRGSPNNQQVFSWLYGLVPYGGTNLHNAVDRVASYYTVGGGSRENPWSRNPAAREGTANPELSCRRSFNLLFSDGAWNSGTSTIAGQDFDQTIGPIFARTGTTETFRYQPQGINTEEGRKLYTPYGGATAATGGLADLTARYYWHTDLRTALANDAVTRAGQPTFWQNMATYTIGYLIRPRGEVLGATSGLTFGQIDTYRNQYAESGFASATIPSWATGNVNAAGNDQNRIDDFIQAGYTGGGRGFSVSTSSQVRQTFDTILSEILNVSGRDAGVAVGSAPAGSDATIAGRLKYNVEYKTFDNSGDVVAEKLTATGNVDTVAWRASDQLPDPSDRRVFTRSTDSTDTGATEFKGRVSSLPTTVQAALLHGSDRNRVDTGNSNFVDYLRGEDPVSDGFGLLFRQRNSKLGAMVNPPTVFMGAGRDFAYDLDGNVSGSNKYLEFIEAKRTLPPSLFVATNAGMIHNLEASSGEELAAFMPRRSLKRMLPFARDNYTFQYILDGPLSEHDIYDGTKWNHIAVGTGGRGERLVYALRSPLNASTSDRIPAKEDFLWEVGPTEGPATVGSTTEADSINSVEERFALGHVTNPARSGQTANGDWVVVINSGHYNGESDGSRHGLLVLNALNGEVLKRIPLPADHDAGRGLGGVTLVRNADRRVVAAYAGDAKGNLWRFNLLGKPEEWSVSYNKPLFTTEDNRPIYGAPAWQVHPKGGTIVVVATGILLDEEDAKDTSESEAIYGIWDPTKVGEADVSPFTTVPLDKLLDQGIPEGAEAVSGVQEGRKFYKSTSNKIEWEESATVGKHRGWRFPLGRTAADSGERSIDQIRNVGTSVFINTLVITEYFDIDEESCRIPKPRKNYIYGLRAIDGSTQKSFDTNGDGKLDDVSIVEIGNGGFDRGLAFTELFREPPTSAGIRRPRGADEASGESSPEQQRCRSRNTVISGAAEGSITGGVLCDAAGWQRTQYQLSGPPKN